MDTDAFELDVEWNYGDSYWLLRHRPCGATLTTPETLTEAIEWARAHGCPDAR